LAIVICRVCSHKLRIPDGKRGKVTCPYCGAEWFHPETIELSDIEFRCSMSGARFNVISSRRSPLHKFVIQKIEKAALEATRSPAAEPSSASHQPAIEAVAPSLTLPVPRVGRWLARIVGRKAEVTPSIPSATAPKEPTAGMIAPVALTTSVNTIGADFLVPIVVLPVSLPARAIKERSFSSFSGSQGFHTA
jgi:uncharacterized Zn-finger protein